MKDQQAAEKKKVTSQEIQESLQVSLRGAGGSSREPGVARGSRGLLKGAGG